MGKAVHCGIARAVLKHRTISVLPRLIPRGGSEVESSVEARFCECCLADAVYWFRLSRVEKPLGSPRDS